MSSSDIVSRLHKAASDARKKSYSPYSNFKVGAALLGADGNIYAAANVENAAYPQSQCAEASAIGVMVAAGCTEIKEVLVLAEAPGPDPVSPCGGCRQRLNEFAAPEVVIHMANEQGVQGTIKMGELLPHSFGPKQLER
jgi:cytidine deaminase